jgi:uncharacterized protein
MKQLALGVALVSLVACARQAPDSAPAVATPAEAPAAQAADPAAPSMPPLATAPDVAPALPIAPSFDCAHARGEIEQLVCADPELARLDRQLAERFAQVKDLPQAKSVVAEQRGWIEGRDSCWKADDKTACVRDAYRTRLVELAINGGQAVVPIAVEYRCDDDSKPLTAVFYNDIDPQAAVITWGNDQAIAFPVPAASGARYGRERLDFWEHQGEVKLDFYGNQLTCKPAG